MDKKLTIGGVLQQIVAYGLLLVFLLAWPLQLIKQPVVSGSSDRIRWDLPTVYQTAEMVHEFKPQFDYLESISFYINNEWEEGTYISISCYLFDQNQELIMGEEFLLDATAYPGYFTIPVNQYVDTAKNYVYLVHAQNKELYIASTEIAETSAIESLKTYVNNEEQERVYAVTTFSYKTPVMWPWVMAYVLCSVFFVGMIGVAEQKLIRTKVLVPKYSQDGVIKTLLKATVVIGGIVGIWAVYPMKVFGTSPVDNGLYIVAILLLGSFLLYGTQKVLEPTKLWATICDKKKRKNYVQSFCFGMAFIQTCEYVNATFEYTHQINMRQMAVWLLLALLTMIEPKQFTRKPAWVVTAIGICSGIAYYVSYGMGIDPDTSALVLWDAYQLCFGIIILYHFARMLFTKKITKLSIPYMGLLAVMWTLLYLFHQERTWMNLWVFPIGLFYGMVGQEEDTTDFLQNLRSGIVISFLWMVGYCLMHRPFYFYMYTRYPMYFHTVTVTAMYLVLVFMAVFVQLLIAHKRKSKGQIYSSLLLLGMVTSYIIFTISRTGIIASIVSAVALLICMSWFGKQRKQLNWLSLCGGIIATVILSFPVWFTITRMVPSIVNEPVQTEIELFSETIVRGEPMDSYRYVTLERFLALLDIRFGVNEEVNNQNALTEPGVNAKESDVEIKVDETITEDNKSTAIAYTNGRVEIWKYYLSNVNWSGHELMGVTIEEDSVIHAHNSFIQILYDHGWLTGVFFCVFYLITAIRALFYYLVDPKVYKRLLPLGIIGAFGIVSMAEWAIHPCIPIGLGFLMCIAPLMKKIERK